MSIEINAQNKNVILIIADDLGKDYLSLYDQKNISISTPNIEKLAKRGIVFNNAWSNPVCSPTRAGILTGRYSFRTGVGSTVGGPNSIELNPNENTLPKMLKEYFKNKIGTANIGKWHLSSTKDKSNYTIPNKMGYDHYEGPFSGSLKSYTDWVKIKNGETVQVSNYATTENIDNAINWINNQSKKNPFFLWLAVNAPHVPYHLPPSNLIKETKLTGTEEDIKTNPQEYYKLMVEAFDTELGRLFTYLEKNKQWENTEIIFIGDNGIDREISDEKGQAKGTVYQRGISVPFIISGPSVINPNRKNDALVNTHDLFATILELYGFKNWSESIAKEKPVDSKSLLPIITNTKIDIRTWIFSEIFKTPSTPRDAKTIRNSKYKLIKFDNGKELFFDLSTDPNEKENLLLKVLNIEQKENYESLVLQINNLLKS